MSKKAIERFRRENLRLYNPKKIFLLTTKIISDYNDGSEAGPRCGIIQYYLAKKVGEEYYELFSKCKINNTQKKFNLPTIEKVDKMEEHIKSPIRRLSAKELFFFITQKNTEERIKKD